MEEVMTKKLVIWMLLAFPLLVSAQRSHMPPGRSIGHGGGSYSQAGLFAPGRFAGTNPAYNPRFASNFYSSGFNNGNYFYGPSNGTILGPGFNNGSQPNILTFMAEQAPPVQTEYIPTYMRSDPGPSLGEIAKSLRTERKPAVLVWSNWESPAKRND